jgi:hypothetical protein
MKNLVCKLIKILKYFQMNHINTMYFFSPKKFNKFLNIFWVVVFTFMGYASFSQVVVGSTTSGSATSFTTTLSFSHQVVAGNNRLLVVGVTHNRNGIVNGINYNGIGMILAGSVINNGGNNRGYLDVYYMVNPPIGTYTVQITFQDSDDRGVTYGATNFTGVDQATPIGAFIPGQGTSAVGNSTLNTITLSNIPAVSGSIIYSALSSRDHLINGYGAGQNELWNLAPHGTSNDRNNGAVTLKTAISTNETVTYTRTNDNRHYVIGAMSINPVDCGGTTTTTLTAVSDTEIWTTFPNDNYGACNAIYINRNPLQRGLIQFDLTGIPSNATITSATFRMTKFGGNNTSHDLSVHRITNSWSEGVGGCGEDNTANSSWNNRMTGVPWTTPGGDFVATPAATTSVGGNGQYDWNITSLAQNWLDGTFNNHGVILGFSIESGSDQKKDFRSREHGIESERPLLIVTYTLPFTATVTKTDISCFGANDGQIVLSNPSGGSGNYEYRLNLGVWQSSGTFTGLSADTYNVQIRDANNTVCETSLGDFIINEPTVITGTVTKTEVSCNGAGDGVIEITSPSGGGGGPYQYRLNLGDWQSSNVFNNLGPGSYNVQIRNASAPFCDVSLGNIQIAEPTQVVVNGTTVNVSCNGGNNGSITQTVTGGVSPYSYSWSDLGPDTKDRSMLAAGNYTVTVTDNSGCQVVRNYNILQPAAIAVNATVNQPDCGVSGSILLNVSGGVSPYSYNWTGPDGSSNLQNRTNLVPGTYAVTITDANNCTFTASYLLIEPDCSGGEIVCLNSTANAIYSVTPDPVVTMYNWTVPTGAVIVSGQGTSSIEVDWSGASPGDAQICVSSENICGESNLYCENITLKLVNAFALASPACIGDNLLLQGEGGTEYQWSGPNGFSSTLQNPVIFGATVSNAGTYVVTVTDDDGCFATASVDVVLNTPPSLSANVNTSACGLSIGSIFVTVTGGTSPYNYAWSNGEITKDITSLPGGNYVLTVTDANGCSSIVTRAVGDLDGPSVTATPTDNVCNGGSEGEVSLSVMGGTPPINFFWSNGETTQNISGLSAGFYSVTATDNFGCVGVASAFVNQPNPIQINATRTDVTCFGENDGTIDVTVTGGTPGYTYAWSDGGGNVSSRSGLAAGPYIVSVTDANMCVSTRLIIITQPGQIIANATASPVSCHGGSNGVVTLNVLGGVAPLSYSWSGPNTFSATTQNIIGLSAGVYNVTVTDANGCSTTASATVNQPTQLNGVANKVDVLCNGASTGSIDLAVSGGTPGYSYLWTNGAITQDIGMLEAGTYEVTVTDNNGCSVNTSATINEADALTFSTTKVDVLCFGGNTGSIDLTVTGGAMPYIYLWSNDETTKDITNLTLGVYTVTVTDNNNCTSTQQTSIDQNTEIIINEVISNVICNADNTGEISLTVIGGVGPYTYAWTGSGSGTSVRTGLSNGNYTVTVTDSEGCTTTRQFVVSEPDELEVSGMEIDVSCTGFGNGEVILTVNGGVTPYQYVWSNNTGTQNAEDLEPGAYSVTVTDNNNCTATEEFEIIEPDALDVIGTLVNNCPNQSNGSVSLSVSGGTSPFTYNWTGSGSGAQVRTGLAAGSYTVTVTDAQGCEKVSDYVIAPLELEVLAFDRDCISENGEVFAVVSNGNTPYTFSWSGPGGYNSMEQNISGLDVGTYSITITDNNNCVLTGSETVGSPNCLPPVAEDDNFTTPINTPISQTVATNDSDPQFPISELIFIPLTFSDPLTEGVIEFDDDFLGGFTFTPINGFVGTVSIEYQVCNPLDLCDVAVLTITVIGPDVTPVITAIPNVMQGVTEFNLSVRVTELNDINTNGLITVRIPKDSRLSFKEAYDPSKTMLGATPVNNADWSFTEDATNYIFSSTVVIPAGGFSTFGFIAEFNPGNTKGIYTITSQIDSGSGGEVRIDNNVDSERIDYFID